MKKNEHPNDPKQVFWFLDDGYRVRLFIRCARKLRSTRWARDCR